MKTKLLLSVLLVLFLWHPQLIISQDTASIRLGPATGQDCGLASYIPFTPLPHYDDIVAAAWTYGGEFNLWRPLLRFNLNEIPANALIISARLSLYANPSPVSAPHSGSNQSYLRKVTSPWDQNTVTWETQPDFSTVNQVLLHQSNNPSEDYLDLDVTELVRGMAANPATNFGFIIMTRIEYYYRSMNFASSECSDVNKRPKLDVIYTTLVSTVPITSEIPAEYKLSQNFPNPFNPVTNIKFDLPKNSFTKLTIYNQMGKEVSILVKENLNPGSYQVQWDGSNFSSGAYFIKLESGSVLITKKIMLIK